MHRRRRSSLSTEAIPQPIDPQRDQSDAELDRLDKFQNLEAATAGGVAAETLDPELGLVAGLDTVGFGRAVVDLWTSLLGHPAEVVRATHRFTLGSAYAAWTTGARTLGLNTDGPFARDKRDRRFQDPAWTRNPWYHGLEQAYLAWAQWVRELVDAGELDPITEEKAAWIVNLAVDALAPPNYLWGNPAALRKAIQTNGRSVIRGLHNMVYDLNNNNGRPRQVDTRPFRLGENLAATPGKVVYRNDLMELIQYEPQTETVHEVPLLLSPPWINKYYIMDLAPGRSFAEWAISRGHTVFAISYRNPDESMRNVALDDYLINGPHTALDVIQEITGADQANIVGLCLGGTLTAMLAAYLADTGEDRIRSATLLNTLIDFSEPGPMGCFLDREAVRRLDARMLQKGYLDSSEMSTMFDLLRARDLIWNYVISGWLMGEDPPAFDILTWNRDGTRMPAEMHSFYLRYCYVENQLARGEMTLAGTRLKLEDVKADTYLLSAKDDHIAPWTSSYAATRLLGGKNRFVLSSSGHVAGIVNPPGTGRTYWTNDELPDRPEAWFQGATQHKGSWWEDWAEWAAVRAGERKAPPPMGSKKYAPLADAPGAYVHEK